jgi:hypothetical protein
MATTDYILSNFIQQTLQIPVLLMTTGPKPVFPCVVYSKRNGQGTMTHSGPGYKTAIYTYSVKAKTAALARFYADQIYSLLQGYNNEIYAINGSSIEDYDELEEIYSIDQDYETVEGGTLPYFRPITGQGVSGSIGLWYENFYLTGSNAIVVSGSDIVIQGNLIVSGSTSINISSSFMTAGYAEHAATASFFAGFIESASYAALANTSSYALTASFALNTPTLPSGLVSSSAQVLNSSGVYSSSAQLPVGLVSSSAQATSWTVATASFALNTPTLPSGLVSSSAQVLGGSNVFSSSAQLPTGTVSSSTQIDFTDIQNKPTTIATASFALTASQALTSSYVKQVGEYGRNSFIVDIPNDAIVAHTVCAQSVIVSGSIDPEGIEVPGWVYVTGDVETNGLKANGETVLSEVIVFGGLSMANGSKKFNCEASAAFYGDVYSHNTMRATSSWSNRAVSASFATAAGFAPTKAGVVSSSAQLQFGNSYDVTFGVISGSQIRAGGAVSAPLIQGDSFRTFTSSATPTSVKLDIATGSAILRNGNLTVAGSIFGTASFATSASYALTASYATNAGATSIGTDTIDDMFAYSGF